MDKLSRTQRWLRSLKIEGTRNLEELTRKYGPVENVPIDEGVIALVKSPEGNLTIGDYNGHEQDLQRLQMIGLYGVWHETNMNGYTVQRGTPFRRAKKTSMESQDKGYNR